MTVILTIAFRKMTSLIEMLKSRGIKVHKKTILTQLVLLGVISVFELTYLVSNALFW